MKKIEFYIVLIPIGDFMLSCTEKKPKNNDHKIIKDTSASKAKRKIRKITEIEISDLSGFLHRPARISFSEKIYLYNEGADLLEERRCHYYMSVCDVYDKYIYKYDIKKNKVEEYYYNPKSSLNLKTVFKYDTNRKMIEEAIFCPNGKLKKKITFKYDNKGNKIEEKMYDKDGCIQAKRTYKYDKQGNQIERNLYGQEGSPFITETYNYVYDEAGNWLRKSHFNYNGLMSVTVREIIYY